MEQIIQLLRELNYRILNGKPLNEEEALLYQVTCRLVTMHFRQVERNLDGTAETNQDYPAQPDIEPPEYAGPNPKT